VLILDETVAALDAAHGTRALEVAAAHSRATVLIAHP
jgi:ABC-type hemin transport system ATPase subunit